MIKLECTQVYGWEAAIRGMRNPMNSWDKSDSGDFCQTMICCDECPGYTVDGNGIAECRLPEGMEYVVGPNDHKLMMSLAKSGTDHAKYRRMINVTVDITAPLYWWKEFDTYKVGTVANSCSTMHKIADKEFTLEDFSWEHLIGENIVPDHVDENPYDTAHYYILGCLNYCRDCYLETKDKIWWWQMIQLLPTSYNQKRTVQMNYEVLAHIYPSRKNHKLDEWHTFCDWIEKLPYSEIITGEGEDE